MADVEHKHPSSWILLLIAAVLIAAVAGLLVLLTRLDAAKRVMGNPMEFREPQYGHQVAQPPAKELFEPRPVVEEPGEPDVVHDQEPEELIDQVPEELIEEIIDEVIVVRAQVYDVVSDHLFWIGASPEQRVPVLLLGERTGRQPEQRVEIKPGQKVEIVGMVRASDPAALFQGASLLSDSERSDLLSSKMYISALRVIVISE